MYSYHLAQELTNSTQHICDIDDDNLIVILNMLTLCHSVLYLTYSTELLTFAFV